MLATIVRSPLALSVAGEEPERGGLLKIAKRADIPARIAACVRKCGAHPIGA
jgi:hypothetical protein